MEFCDEQYSEVWSDLDSEVWTNFDGGISIKGFSSEEGDEVGNEMFTIDLTREEAEFVYSILKEMFGKED